MAFTHFALLHIPTVLNYFFFFFITCFEDGALQTEANSKVKKELLWGMEFSAAQTVLPDLGVPTSKGLPSPLPSAQAEKRSLVRRLARVCVVCECASTFRLPCMLPICSAKWQYQVLGLHLKTSLLLIKMK